MTPIPCSGWSLLGCPHLMQQALLAHSLLQCKIRCEDRWVERQRKMEREVKKWKTSDRWGRGRTLAGGWGSLLAAKHRRVEDPHTKPCQCWKGKMEESWREWHRGWDMLMGRGQDGGGARGVRYIVQPWSSVPEKNRGEGLHTAAQGHPQQAAHHLIVFDVVNRLEGIRWRELKDNSGLILQ